MHTIEGAISAEDEPLGEREKEPDIEDVSLDSTAYAKLKSVAAFAASRWHHKVAKDGGGGNRVGFIGIFL